MSRSTAILFIFICLCTKLFAQEANLKFEHIGLEQGLSQSTISAIMQDSQGFMWFGTQEGLNRFDGCTFTIYKYQPDDSTSLPENYVSSILEDRFGDLWIGTFGGGLSRLSRQYRGSEKFTHYQFEVADKNSISDNFINAIYEDRNGSLWIGTRRGLNKLIRSPDSSETAGDGVTEEKFTFMRFWQDSTDNRSLSHNFVTAMCEDRAGKLWIGTRGGLNVMDREKNQFLRYFYDEKNPHSIGSNSITAIYRDRAGTLWIGTGGGLAQYDDAHSAFISLRHDPEVPTSLSSNYVTAISGDYSPDGSEPDILWVATNNAGLNALHLGGKSFSHYRPDPANVSSISSDYVSTVYVDRSGLLWAGTSGGGLNKADRKMKKFAHYAHEPDNLKSLSNNFIWAFCEDRNGELWVGSDEGLTRFDRKQNKVKRYYHDPRNKNSLTSSRIVSIFLDPDTSGNVLWIGTPTGLNRFEPDRERFTHFVHDPNAPNSLSHSYVLVMHTDRSGELWIGTVRGLNKFDRASGTFIRYPLDPENDLRNIWVKSILEMDDRFMWIGSRFGLILFDRQLEKYCIYRHDRADRESLSHHDINSLHHDSEGNLWIGTAGGGLNKLNASELLRARKAMAAVRVDGQETKPVDPEVRRERFVHFTENNGLCNNYIYGILPDGRGRLWLSTNRGLSCFDPLSQTFKNYDVNDGLQSYEFNQGAFYRSASGEMFFGGINGFNTFSPERLQDNPYVPPVAITAFKKLDKSVRFDQGFGDLKRILMSHSENFFSFEFVALDYTNPLRNNFAYKLEGFDQDWIYCGARRYAIYTNVAPGNYVFRVKGSNSDGVWNEQGASLQVGILPPYWRTWWFSMVSAGSLISGAFFFIQTKVRQKIRRALELEAVRSQENERVRKQVADDFHDELGQRLTNMTLMAEVLKRNLHDISPQNAVYLEKIRETSKSLSNGVRNFIWALDPQQDSLYDLGIYLKDFGDEIFDKSGIHFRTKGVLPELESVKLPMQWRRHLALLFKEGMNNVLKHASCQNVTLEMSMMQDSLVIALADDGKGFNGRSNEKSNGSNGNGYHDNEQNGINGEPGRGLGSMSSRAAKLQGRVNVISNLGNGTTIQFTGNLPKRVIEHDHSLNR